MPSSQPGVFQPTPILRPRRRIALRHVRLKDADGMVIDAMLQDISANGLRGGCRSGSIGPNDVVTLELPAGRSVWGVVRWTDGAMFGVEFDTLDCQNGGLPSPWPPLLEPGT